MEIIELLRDAVSRRASDIFLVAGRAVTYKIDGVFVSTQQVAPLMPADTKSLVEGIYHLAGQRDISRCAEEGDDDFSFALSGVSRFRVSAYKQRGSLAAVIRIITFELPHPEDLHIPEGVLAQADRTKGLVLVTGSAGSGKSTTLACLIDRINRSRSGHIITLEDPLEFLHRHQKSIVSQREISSDTQSYVAALRAALRQSPDVILLGEMRDYETMTVAMTAAETGHLIISTLHTVGAANTIDRIIDAFPPNQQQQIRVQLAMVLQAVVSQQLLPTEDGKRMPAFEIMSATPAIRNMIREAKVHQLDTAIQSSAADGMVSMDTSLFQLWQQGQISAKTAVAYSVSPERMEKRMLV